MSGDALTAYHRIKVAAQSRRHGVRLTFEECAAIYYGDTAVRDAIDNVLLAAEEAKAAQPNYRQSAKTRRLK